MRSYESKEELKNEIKKTFEKYISEFDNIPEELKDKRLPEVDRTPAENLAYQVGWTTLVLKWEEDEKKGIDVKTPSDKFKWNQLGELYQWFTDTYAHKSLYELKEQLTENVKKIYLMIDELTDEELFKPHMRKWADEATKTATWEVYKFIHVNTVAPFGTFRTKIRKWKKLVLYIEKYK
ncbi:TPA: ClbS/DfsB family four-helix bundle protein [Streptococcus pyogenes]|nr:ClbS/DfsB family four-helix bundle protein [Streptococcus pyogenes]